MATNYPRGIDTTISTLPNPLANTTEDAAGNLAHNIQHSNANDAIRAIETLLGINATQTVPVSGGVLAGVSATSTKYSAALTQYGVVIGGGAGAVPTATAAGTTGQVLTAVSGGAPVWSSSPTLSQLTLAGDPGLTMTTAASRIVPGATSQSLRNNANNADNVLITDAGVMTIRAGLTVTTGVLTVSAAGTHVLGPNTSQAGSTNTSIVVSGQNSGNAGFSLRQGATERAAFSAASDGNTYWDYQGTMIGRESTGYAGRFNITTAGVATFNGGLVTGTGVGVAGTGSGLTVGAASTNNNIWNASQGSSTATLYVGNAQITVVSDVRVKRDIEPTVIDALGLLRRLPVVDFEWDDPSDRAYVNRNTRGRWTGLTAQSMIDVVPWLVNAEDRECATCRAGLHCTLHRSSWQVDLGHMAGVFVKGFQEVDDRLLALEAAR